MQSITEFAVAQRHVATLYNESQRNKVYEITQKGLNKLKRSLEDQDPNIKRFKPDNEREYTLQVCSEQSRPQSQAQIDRCVFCGKKDTHMYRHFTRQHADHPRVIEFTNQDDSARRRKLRKKLKVEGNLKYPDESSRQNQTSSTRKHTTIACYLCKKTMSLYSLARHVKKTCPLRGKVEDTKPPTSSRPHVKASLVASMPEESEWQKTIMSRMQHDDVYSVIMQDPQLKYFFEWLCFYYRCESESHLISKRIRLLGSFLKFCRDSKERFKTILDLINPANFLEMMEALYEFAGINEQGKMIQPSKAKRAGEILYQCARRLRFQAIGTGDEEMETSVNRFEKMYTLDFNDMRKEAKQVLRVRQFNSVQLLPLMKDIKKFNEYLHAQLVKLTLPKSKDYIGLCKCLMVRTVTFNRKRAGEVMRLHYDDYKRAEEVNKHDLNEDIKKTLDPVSIFLAEHMFRIEFVGKKGQSNALLCTPLMLKGFQKLDNLRQKTITYNSVFMFARENVSRTPYSATDAIKETAKKAKVSEIVSMQSTKLRKQIATMSHALHLTDHLQEDLCKFLGHSMDIHKKYYRLPLAITDKTVIAKVLLLMSNGEPLGVNDLDEVTLDYVQDFEEDEDTIEHGVSSEVHIFNL